jgi:Sigma-70, region 4
VVKTKNPSVVIDKATIYQMRQSGETLHGIGEKFGITRERVRQILLNTYGSTHHQLLSTSQISSSTGESIQHLKQLYEDGIIAPTFSYDIGKQYRFIWSKSTIQIIKNYYKMNRICRVCGKPLPSSRRRYCSDSCHQEKNYIKI